MQIHSGSFKGKQNPKFKKYSMISLPYLVGNTAEGGGGIYIDPYYPSRVNVCSDEVTISPNDPDDPPKTRPCP